MALRTETKLTTKLALTPQLQLGLKVLAMNALELSQHIEAVLERNPLLELEEPEGAPSREEELESLDSGDARWDWLGPGLDEDFREPPEARWRDEPTLLERLHEQIEREPMPERERAIAHALVESLDEDGYFREDPARVAELVGAKASEVVRVLETRVHRLEPAGIGARDLRECLLLQLEEDDPIDRLCRQALNLTPEQLAGTDAELAGALGCPPDLIPRVRARLRRLDPWPGHGMRGEPGLYIRPELAFVPRPGGGFDVELLDTTWQRLKIQAQWAARQWTGRDRAFVREALEEARMLLHALEQRASTLLKVGRVLADKQRDFLRYGVLGLRPLRLQDVADALGLHESTISRVVAGKYARTPLGVIELKRFFSTGLATADGGAISVHRVRERIRALILSEPKKRPLSDQTIAERLQAEGIAIARRTVAKYREQMGIPSSSERRKQYRKQGGSRCV